MPGLVDIIVQVLQACDQPVLAQRLKIQLRQRAVSFQLAVIVDVPAVPDRFRKGVEMPVVVLLVGIRRDALKPAVIHVPVVKHAVFIAIPLR